jgi:hypothetical protein
VSPELLRRQAVLAPVALLAALAALALGRNDRPVQPDAQAPPSTGVGTWRTVRAGTIDAAKIGRRTDCHVVLAADTLGVAHPILPCGAQIVVAYEGREVQTAVVAHGPAVAGRGLDLTPALARALRVEGVRTVRWRFAGSAG